MRDMMRAQIEEATQKGTIGSLLDNTVVLVMLLIIVVLGTAYFLREAPPTPVPEEVTSLADKEPERLIKQADYYREIGNYEKAWEILANLNELLPNDEEYSGLKAKINVRLKQIEKASVDGESLTMFLERALARAEQAAEDGNPREAIGICDAILVLYQNNPEAESAVAEARQIKTSQTARLSEE